MKNQEVLLKKFREKDFKITPQRLAVLKSLDGDKSHPGINEVYNRLKDDYPSLSKTTVYNTFEMLKEIGEVIELHMEKSRVRYDPDTSVHDHILCTKCNKIEDIPTRNKKISVGEINGFKITGVSNQYYGICEQCQ